MRCAQNDIKVDLYQFIITTRCVLPQMFSAHSQRIGLTYKFAYFLPYILITAVKVSPSALLGEDVDGCQATAYPCHPLQPLDVMILRRRALTHAHYQSLLL